MRRLSEAEALARLQRGKTAYQSHVRVHFEPAARACRTCPTAGVCCTDAHFVNVHITRLEAAAIRETLRRTPRLDEDARRAVYARAHAAVARYGLQTTGDTFAQTFSCPLFEKGVGCLVHARAKPAPCIQHACYDSWEDVPPVSLQWRTEARVEHLNEQVYGAAWAWLPLPLWLTLVDPASDGAELSRLAHEWSTHRRSSTHAVGTPRNNSAHRASLRRRSLPVIR
ncbi:MAG TPA: hypothetical protein VNA19_08225 [Pyrinomonadaceae bacterium]|jgi:hypothetical protein|nr:hypothetical protein [Pyrinomonadaceae bacterium]